MKEDYNFEFYVLNYDFNKKKVINFNIFHNIRVNSRALKYVKKHLRNKNAYPFEEFKKDLNSAIMCEEWTRREYEISVGDAFESDISKFEKIDCYFQAKPNMDIIAHEVIRQYKEQRKAMKEKPAE